MIPFSNTPEEKEVLILLEHAYSAGRYEDEYLINQKELKKIKNELASFQTKVENLYTKHLQYCLRRINGEPTAIAEESNAKTSFQAKA